MRKILPALIVFLFFCENLSLFAQEVNYSDPQTWLLGYFQADDLLQYPHSEWFNKQFDSYKIDDEALIELMNLDIEDIEVVVVLGTWCPDSRREVPRFMKLSQLIGLDQGKVSFIGTDSYKIAPVDDYDNLDIERVPTFIFYYKKNETGRIIEYPEASLEKDMINILEAKDKRQRAKGKGQRRRDRSLYEQDINAQENNNKQEKDKNISLWKRKPEIQARDLALQHLSWE